MQVSEDQISQIVRQVVAEIKGKEFLAYPAEVATKAGVSSPAPKSRTGDGVWNTMHEAVSAAGQAFAKFEDLSLEARRNIIQAIREVGLRHKEEFSRLTLEETGMGRLEDKIKKHEVVCNLTPGTEDIEPRAWSGDFGLTVDERAPFGVIGAILPSTHPVPTMLNNAISMLAAGNTIVFNPHPATKKIAAYALTIINQAMVKAGAPENLINTVAEPAIETAQELFRHPEVRLLCVTGGPAVVRAALGCGKRVIAAGPGNPPVVVDETADLRNAAEAIIAGAGFDNNILCTAEKVIIPVESIAEELKSELKHAGAVELTTSQMDRLAGFAFTKSEGSILRSSRTATAKDESGGNDHGQVIANRELIGRNASVLAERIGVKVGDEVRILFGETGPDHPFVQEEQLMPCLPLVRVPDVDAAIDLAVQVEHGYSHTAIMHSMNVRNLTKMGRRVNTSIFVKNGPSSSGLGVEGEGTLTYSIAGLTGEGITTARTFTRPRRCAMIGNLNIVRWRRV
jgi:acyl-CoA reductase-like NAD-dependent aldehyde dehydrogenase